MPATVPAQQATWNAVDILELCNPAKGKWTCVSYAKRAGRRCQTVIRMDDIEAAKRLAAELPNISNDTVALQSRLVELVRLCLCKNLHVKDPSRHAGVIVPWLQTIQRAQSAQANVLPPGLSQADHQGTQQSDTNMQHQHAEPSHRSLTAIEEFCTICQDAVGANGDRVSLPCNHAYCDACITRWKQQSRSCPNCRDEGHHSTANQGSSRLRTRSHENDFESLGQLQRQVVIARPETPLGPVFERSEVAQEQESTQPRLSDVERSTERHVLVGQQRSVRDAESSETAVNPTNQREEGQCSICLEGLEHGTSETLRCSHTFCSVCISHWRRWSPRCPYRCEV